MKKYSVLFYVSFCLGLLLISFIAYANQTSISNYYPSASGNYTKVHLINPGGTSSSTFCSAAKAGTIMADPTTGYLEVCKSDGSVASYPGSCFTRFGNSIASPPCPNNYTAVNNSTTPNFGGGGIVSWSCCYTGQGAAAVPPTNSGCFSIYSNAPNVPAACNDGTYGNPNAYDVGCDVIASSDMTSNVFKRNCCFNNTAGSYLLGVKSTCTCVPTTCADMGDQCGSPPNGCGGTLSCGPCSPSYPNTTCSASYQCVCTPSTCAALGDNCGNILPNGNNCGGSLNCGTCPASGDPANYTTCSANQCICTPATCASLGDQCGNPSNGCGGTLSCGPCSPSYPNTVCSNPDGGTCSCTPSTCATMGFTCGTPVNGNNCGGSLSCNPCSPSYPNTVCSNPDGGTCSCTPSTCTSLGDQCGAVLPNGDNCGAALNCGPCPGSESCVNNQCTGCEGITCGSTCCPVADTECSGTTCCQPNGTCTPTYQCGTVPGTDSCGNPCTTDASCSFTCTMSGSSGCPSYVECNDNMCEWEYVAAAVVNNETNNQSFEICNLSTPIPPVTAVSSPYCDNGLGNYYWEAGAECPFELNCQTTVCTPYECAGGTGSPPTYPGYSNCGVTCQSSTPESCNPPSTICDPADGYDYCCTPVPTCPTGCIDGSGGSVTECGGLTCPVSCDNSSGEYCATAGDGTDYTCCDYDDGEEPCSTEDAVICCDSEDGEYCDTSGGYPNCESF